MILVGVCALFMTAEVYRRRRLAHQERAVYHAKWEAVYRGIAESSRRSAAYAEEKLRSDDLSEADLRGARSSRKIHNRSVRINTELAEFHRRMKVKWEYAAGHPWLAVEPDPPE